jgi:hypothetical protein
VKRAVVSLVLVLGAAGASWLLLRPTGEQRAVARIRGLGGDIRVDEGRTGRPVVAVDLHTRLVTDDDLACLTSLPELRFLGLTDTAITDDGLRLLRGLANLEELALASPGVTDAGLVHLKDARNLKELSLGCPGVTDAGLGHLERLTGLRELDVGGTRISDAGLARLRRALPGAHVYRLGGG